MNNPIFLRDLPVQVEKQLKKVFSGDQWKDWENVVGWCVEWDPKPIVLSPENALNARYQILGVRAGDRFHNLMIALRIVVWPKSGDRATVVQWFDNKRFNKDERFSKELAGILDPLLPISIGWRVVYATRQPTDTDTDTDSIIDIARLGSWVLGERFLGENGMQDKIVEIVKELLDKDFNKEKEEILRKRLTDFFAETFKDGQIITANDLNSLKNRLDALETKLNTPNSNPPENPITVESKTPPGPTPLRDMK